MAADYTVTKLLEDVRRIAGLPTNVIGTTWSTNALAFADAECQEYIVPLLVNTAEEYLISTEQVTLSSGTSAYAIPTRAVGNKLRDVQIQDSTGVWVSLPRIEPENASRYGTSGSTQGYMFQGAKVLFLPTPSAAGTARFVYYRRPSRLVTTGYIVAESFTNNTPSSGLVTFGVNSGSLDYTGTGPIDVVSGAPPFDLLIQDGLGYKSGSNWVVPGSITFPFGFTPYPRPYNMYLCRTDETPVPQIPADLYPLLAHRTAVRMLESMGDPRAEQVEARAARLEKKCVELISPRGEGLPRVVINYSGPGWSRRRRSFNR